MTIDEQIGAFLAADVGVTALIDSSAVSLSTLPQGAVNGLAYEQISGPRECTLDGRTQINARWQFTAYAQSPVAAREIVSAVLDALEFFRGYFVEGGLFVEINAAEDERGPMYDYERNLYRYDADLILTY